MIDAATGEPVVETRGVALQATDEAPTSSAKLLRGLGYAAMVVLGVPFGALLVLVALVAFGLVPLGC